MKYCHLHVEVEYEDYSSKDIFRQYKKEGTVGSFPSVMETIEQVRAIVKKEGRKAKRMDFVFAIWHDGSRNYADIYRRCFWINTDYKHKKEFRTVCYGNTVQVSEKEWYIEMGKDVERMIECKKEHDRELEEHDRLRDEQEARELTTA